MYDRDEEEQFKLQVFQQTISTLYMYPLRIYNNNCYKKFEEIISINELKEINSELGLDSADISFKKTLNKLKQIIKHTPSKISIESKTYQILEKYENKIRGIIWKSQPVTLYLLLER